MTSWVRESSVLCTDLCGEAVLLDSSTRALFVLNGTGQLIWHSLEEGLEAAVAAVVEAYEVDPREARRDVLELLGALRELGLVRES